MYDATINMKVFEGTLSGGVSFECTESNCSNDIHLPVGLEGEQTCSECYTTYGKYDILEGLNKQFDSYEDVIDSADNKLFRLGCEFNRGIISKKEYNKELKKLYYDEPTQDVVSSYSHDLSSGFRYKNGKPTITVHTSGSCTINGVKYEVEAQKLLNELTSKTDLQLDSELECSNMNTSGDIKKNLDLETMYNKMNSTTSFVDVAYEPESYPSLRIKVRTSETKPQFIQFFSNGTFTSFPKSEPIFDEMINKVIEFIDEHGEEKNNIVYFNTDSIDGKERQATLTDFKREQITKELASLKN
jgi:TATA-box binding protein (TBP) (component of TFIID and TFIIIB)